MEVEEGKFLLDVAKGVYWHLNEPAVVLVEGLGAGRPLDDIVTEVATAANVDAEHVRTDYTALLRELRKAKLVEGGPR